MRAASRPPGYSPSQQLPGRASCRRSPGKIVERFREITARMRRLIGRENASAMVLENFRRRCRCHRRLIERPAKMLARMAAADRQAVVVQHFIVEAMDQPMLIHQ